MRLVLFEIDAVAKFLLILSELGSVSWNLGVPQPDSSLNDQKRISGSCRLILYVHKYIHFCARG